MDLSLGKKLVSEELFDLSLYRRLRQIATGDMVPLLDELVLVETRHLAFWQNFFSLPHVSLSLSQRLRSSVFFWFCRIFGAAGISLILEAIEINGIRKYLDVWERYKNEPLGQAVREILDDELQHEDAIVSDKIRRQVHPERIRDVFLGLNDGLVEILGAVSGFFVTFQTLSTVLAASFTVAVAGALSMAAGAYVAVGSEQEAESVERGKRLYRGDQGEVGEVKSHPLTSAFIVGISYLFGAAIPIIPVFFGAESIVLSALASLIVVILVSSFLAFLSGMDLKRRIITNVVIIALAVLVTGLIGSLAKAFLGIEI
jgi:VIT1/CCC1 family predicted Fe2+/Mn2+ transporter